MLLSTLAEEHGVAFAVDSAIDAFGGIAMDARKRGKKREANALLDLCDSIAEAKNTFLKAKANNWITDKTED